MTTLVNGDRINNTPVSEINKTITVNVGDIIHFTINNMGDYNPVYFKKHTLTGTNYLIDTADPLIISNNQGMNNGEVSFSLKVPGTYFYTCDTIGLNWINVGPIQGENSISAPSSY